MVLVFVSKEERPGETRVAATPETIKQLVKAGLEAAVQADAGKAASYPNSEYEAAGAKIVSDPSSTWSSADVVLSIHPPSEDQAGKLKQGCALVCSLQPLLALPLVRKLAEAKVTSFAMDLMPRITRAQKMDILSSQATVAGYQAVLLSAAALPKMFPLLMTAAGTLTPARVVILGAGVAGLQAIATARRLGAVVEANDIRPAVAEQVESLGASFIDTGTPPQAESTGGYAKETSAEYARKQKEILTKHLAAADVVIATALIPGRKAPVLVTDDMLQAMREGAVVVDLAVEMGGNVEGSESGKTVEKHGVSIIGDPNLPGRCAKDASQMFGRNVGAFLELLIKESKLEPNWEDECVVGTCVTHDGDIKHGASADALSAKGAS